MAVAHIYPLRSHKLGILFRTLWSLLLPRRTNNFVWFYDTPSTVFNPPPPHLASRSNFSLGDGAQATLTRPVVAANRRSRWATRGPSSASRRPPRRRRRPCPSSRRAPWTACCRGTSTAPRSSAHPRCSSRTRANRAARRAASRGRPAKTASPLAYPVSAVTARHWFELGLGGLVIK